MPVRTTVLYAVLCTAALASSVHAGQSCTASRPSPQTIARSMALAEHTAQSLEAAYHDHGTRVALLGREGQDLSRYGQTWSHVGWAYRTPEGTWRVVHKLNQCGSNQSLLMRQGLGEFFLDDLWRYHAIWTAPPAALAQALWPLLQERRPLALLHERRYSMLSYAWGTRYQQSNQWALEMLAQAAAPQVGTREQAQAWLRLQGYQPATLHINAMTRLGANISRANIAFDDHPNAQRFAGRIRTVTADSALQWLVHSQGFSVLQQVGE